MAESDDKTTIVSQDRTLEIPGYIIHRPLGRGATATVYLATQKSLERQVALKIMATFLVADGAFRERFLTEGKVIAQLSHPDIVTIHDIGVHQDYYYMSMEYLPGGTLKELIMGKKLPITRTLEILHQITSALGHAHKRGFIHRDVKPANILLREDGTAVLSDFGIVKTLSGTTQMTLTGLSVGTPNYMSPEQALGRAVDAQSDLYSLGIVFYEMLTGNKPYQGKDSFATALMHVNSPVPGLPETLSRYQYIIDRLLAKEPKDRFRNAAELIAALDSIKDTDTDITVEATLAPPIVDAPEATIKRRLKDSYALRWVLGAVVSLPLVGIVINYYLISEISPTPPAPVETPRLTLEIRQRVAVLLTVAEAHMEMGYLAQPPGMNAAETYRQVLELDPLNAEAQRGLQNIANQYAELARQSLANNDGPQVAREHIRHGLAVMPNHADLLTLRERVEK